MAVGGGGGGGGRELGGSAMANYPWTYVVFNSISVCLPRSPFQKLFKFLKIFIYIVDTY